MSTSNENEETKEISIPSEDMQSLAICDKAPPTSANTGSTPVPAEDPAQQTKIDILLNATGNVPIMKKRKWTVEPEKKISWIISFIHKYLKLDAEDKIFLYVNQTFAPAPDQTVKNLYDCYESNGRLVLYYCKSQAWG